MPVNIDQARTKTQAFLTGKVTQAGTLEDEHCMELRAATDFPAYVNAYLREDMNFMNLVDFTQLGEILAPGYTYRQALNLLLNVDYQIPVGNEASRRELQQQFQKEFEQLASREAPWPIINAKQYLAFIDTLARFSEGGAPPDAQVMRDGIAFFRERTEGFAAAKREGHDRRTIPDDLFHEAFTHAARALCMDYVYGETEFPQLPDYITDPVREKLEALRQEHLSEIGKQAVQQPEEASLGSRMEVLIREEIAPLIAAHEKAADIDVRGTADFLKEVETHATSKGALYEHILAQCTAIAEDLGIKVETPQESQPEQPKHNRRF